MNTARIINLFAAVTLIEMMLTIGLGASLADVWAVARDRSLVLRAALANYLLVPAAAAGLLLLFRAPPMAAAGFLIVSVCPGAPFGPPFTAMAKGNVGRAIGLMVILAGSSAIIAPLLLRGLLPFVEGRAPLKINATRLISTLALVQFLPLCVGLYLRTRRPSVACRLTKPFTQVSVLLNLTLICLVLVAQFRMLAAIRMRGYLGMLALLAAAATGGWLLGGPDRVNRTTLAVTTSVRNAGVALVVASGSFPGTPAVTAATAFALFQTMVVALAAVAYGRYVAAGWSAVTATAPRAHPGSDFKQSVRSA